MKGLSEALKAKTIHYELKNDVFIRYNNTSGCNNVYSRIDKFPYLEVPKLVIFGFLYIMYLIIVKRQLLPSLLLFKLSKHKLKTR